MRFLIFLLIIVFFSQSIEAQNESYILSPKETDELIKSYCKVLDETYFDKTRSKEIADTLEKRLAAGELYGVTQLTDRITLLVREMTNDKHFYLGRNYPDVETDDEQITESENKNGGFTEVKIIDKKIGYIKWNEFVVDDESFEKAIAALKFVNGCKQLIFDISECPGGDGRMGSFVLSHLFEDNTYQNLLLKKCTGESEWYQSEVPYNYSNGPKFYEIPIYVIISGKTASAAEYFALTIKEMKRGVILGETIAGAGNPCVMVTFEEYFAFIPVCEIATKYGVSIEGRGVEPNVDLEAPNFLEKTVDYIQNSGL